MNDIKKTFIDENNLYSKKLFKLNNKSTFNWEIEKNTLVPFSCIDNGDYKQKQFIIMSLKYDNKTYKNLFLHEKNIINLPNLYLDEFILDWSEYDV